MYVYIYTLYQQLNIQFAFQSASTFMSSARGPVPYFALLQFSTLLQPSLLTRYPLLHQLWCNTRTAFSSWVLAWTNTRVYNAVCSRPFRESLARLNLMYRQHSRLFIHVLLFVLHNCLLQMTTVTHPTLKTLKESRNL